MRRLFVIVAFCLILFGAAGIPSSAINIYNGVIWTKNETDYQAWITVYNFARVQMGSGWLNPHVRDSWNRCCYSAGSQYYVRAEVKGWRNGQRVNIFDTRIQAVPRVCKTSSGGDIYAYARVVLRKGVGETFFWDRHDIVKSDGVCSVGS